MDASELKRRLAKAREGGRGKYSKGLRDAVIAYAGEQRAQGVGREKVAAELGMSVATLSYWCTPKTKSALAPVTIVSEPASAREIVVAYGSLRVHGLDLAQVAELVRRLG